MLLVFSALAIVSGMQVAADISSPMRLLMVALLALFTVGGWKSFQMLRRPPLMCAATERGVLTYLRGSDYRQPGFLVPWERIRNLDLVTRVEQSGSQRVRRQGIALTVATDAGFSLPENISLWPEPAPGPNLAVLVLDATTPTPGGDALLARLRDLFRTYGHG